MIQSNVQLGMSHCIKTVGEGVWTADLDLHDSKVVAHTLAGTALKARGSSSCPTPTVLPLLSTCAAQYT